MKVYTAKTPAWYQSSEQRNLQLFQTCINLTVKEFRSNIHTFSVEELPPFVFRVFLLGCRRGATNSASHPVHTPFREIGLAGQAGNSTILNTKHSFPGWYKFELQRQKYKKKPPNLRDSCTISQQVHLQPKPPQLTQDSQCSNKHVIFIYSYKTP